MTTATVITDINAALQALNSFLPGLLSLVGMFYAPANALTPFLPVIQDALNAVNTVATATGTDIATATAAVQSHLTPGQPNAPALNG
jgi:hypothetical protein